jgi:hypothetical protein
MSGSVPLRVAGGAEEVEALALVAWWVGNHHEGTSLLSVTAEELVGDGLLEPVAPGWPMSSMVPHTGHLVRLPACWSSALNLRPQEQETEIIVRTFPGEMVHVPGYHAEICVCCF